MITEGERLSLQRGRADRSLSCQGCQIMSESESKYFRPFLSYYSTLHLPLATQVDGVTAQDIKTTTSCTCEGHSG
jgi:hypothetical protein